MGYDPSEPRDDKGMWTSGHGGSAHASAKTTGDHTTDKALDMSAEAQKARYDAKLRAEYQAHKETGAPMDPFRMQRAQVLVGERKPKFNLARAHAKKMAARRASSD